MLLYETRYRSTTILSQYMFSCVQQNVHVIAFHKPPSKVEQRTMIISRTCKHLTVALPRLLAYMHEKSLAPLDKSKNSIYNFAP